MPPEAAQTGVLAAAHLLVLVSPFVFLRLVLGRRPFATLPRGTLPRFLLLGILSAFLALAVNRLLAAAGLTGGLLEDLRAGLPLGRALAVAFLLAGVVEEGAKLLLLRAGLAACPDRATLVVAGLLVGVGFGIVENLANLQGAAAAGAAGSALAVALVRSFVLLHPVATGLAADGLGQRAFGPPRWGGALWRGFALAVLVHGVWDLAVFWQPGVGSTVQLLVFPWLIWWGSRRLSDRVLRLSGRAPDRVAARRPAWAAATLAAFATVHAVTLATSAPGLGMA
ncbi:MAG TPA: PrsW family glutamic-type intramembrane protease, partial [Thermodesulfobacteriota bacterium]|nr:PrsW family glutamic-type intramembrane protease [Thermodesulfobacteriota bacterium]